MSKVSVIIAAYNVERYIEETVSSVLSQSLEDIEVVIVDDCSTDRTFDIIKQFAKLDARVKVVRHDVNQSSMVARKSGIEHATGEYIMFLDGDDTFEPNACELAYNAAVKNNADILQFGVSVFNEKGILAENDTSVFNLYQYLKYVKSKVVSVSEGGILQREKALGKFNFNFVTKLYKRELATKIFEHTPTIHINMAEDILLSYIAFFFAKNYYYIDARLYNYRYGAGITAAGVLSESKLKALAGSWFVYKYLYDWTAKRGKEQICKTVLDRIKFQMLGNIADTLLYKANQYQYNQFIDFVKEYASTEEIVLALAYYVYTEKAMLPDKAAQICSQLEIFTSDKMEAKTIGVFYYRMNNGGIENVMSIVTDLLVKNGYRVVLFTDQEPNKDDYPINAAIKRIVLPAVQDFGLESIERRITYFRKMLLEQKIDIMLYNAWINPYLVLDELIIKSCNVKLIVHTHGVFCSDVISTLHSAAYNNMTICNSYSLTDMVVALTDVDLAWWRAVGLRAEKTVNPVQLSLDTAPAKLNGKNIIYSGRIDNMQKQTLQAVQIAELVSKKIPDATLTVIGGCDDLEYKKQIETYIADHKLEKVVKMVGFTKNVLSYYQNADVMLCTSKFEGFSLSLTEGKVCGLPLVCYYLSNWDMARDPKGMVNIPQNDIHAAADAVVEILQNDDLKKRMGEQARESARELYSIDLAAHWKYIFAETLKKKEKVVGVEIKPPLEEAAITLVDFMGDGILRRSATPTYSPADGDLLAECKKLIDMLNEIGSSESYKLGLFLTAIPRKIKNWFKKKK